MQSFLSMHAEHLINSYILDPPKGGLPPLFGGRPKAALLCTSCLDGLHALTRSFARMRDTCICIGWAPCIIMQHHTSSLYMLLIRSYLISSLFDALLSHLYLISYHIIFILYYLIWSHSFSCSTSQDKCGFRQAPMSQDISEKTFVAITNAATQQTYVTFNANVESRRTSNT
jgi:hypothetical protein